MFSLYYGHIPDLSHRLWIFARFIWLSHYTSPSQKAIASLSQCSTPPLQLCWTRTCGVKYRFVFTPGQWVFWFKAWPNRGSSGRKLNSSTDFYPMPRRIQPIRSLECRCVFCGTPRWIHWKCPGVHPAFITTTKSSRRTPGSVRRPSLIYLSLDFATAEPNSCLEFDILKFKSSEKPVPRDGRKTEYFM